METLPDILLPLTLLLFLGGVAAGLVFCRADRAANLLSFGGAALASLCGALAAVLALVNRRTVQFDLWPSLIPYLRCSVKLDPLGAFFVLLLSLLGLALSIYSLGYVRCFSGRKSVGVFCAFFNALLLATALVFTANNAFFFLLAWEIMALTAYCLVSFEHEDTETRNAGVLYFVMSHIGTGCLILGFLLLFHDASNNYSFVSFHRIGDQMTPDHRDTAFLLFLIGFGVKAGIVPLHI